jgi:CheY-like chemotaxis protein
MSNGNYKSVSLLLVEDDDVDAMGITRALTKMKLANPLFRARDGIEALEMLRNKVVTRPYLILLDLNMPRMNGLELLAELRADLNLTDSIVFVLTTSEDDEDKTAAYKQHIAGYIVKSKLDTEFSPLIQLLDHYWHLVELPINNNEDS